MGLDLDYTEGQTPLDEDEKEGSRSIRLNPAKRDTKLVL